MIQFDSTVNLGQLVTFLGFVIGGLGVVFTLRAEVRGLTSHITDVEAELKKMSDVLVTLGRQDEQIKAVHHRLDNLERRP